MKKLQCELCNSIDIVKIENDMFQCQSCGCKYTEQQAKALLFESVEITIGNAERNRLIDNIEAKTKLGISANDDLYKLMHEYPSDYHGYWLSINNTFKEIYKRKKLYSLWSNGLEENYSCLLNLLSDKSELSRGDVEVFYENSFKKLYDDLIIGEIGGLYDLHFIKDWEIHPLIAKAYKMGYDNAKLLIQNNIYIRPKNQNYDKIQKDSFGNDLYSFASNGENLEKPFFVLGKDIYWIVTYDREYHGLLPDNLIPIEKNIENILQSLGNPSRCPKCNVKLKEMFFTTRMKCPKCGKKY